MIDQDNHIIDPVTGFAKHAETGHLIGIEQAPAARVHRDIEWPKWIVPHESHIIRKKVDGAPDAVSTPAWSQCHVNRVDGAVTVLVANEDEEKAATSEFKAEKPNDPSVDEATLRRVHRDVEQTKNAQREAIARDEAAEQAELEVEEAARRTAEDQERLAHDKEEAARLASQQSARLDEKLGDPRIDDRRRTLSNKNFDPTNQEPEPQRGPVVTPPYADAEPNDNMHKAFQNKPSYGPQVSEVREPNPPKGDA